MTRMMIITMTHRSSWRVFENEVKEWLNDVWEELHINRPDYFTDTAIARIPPDILPGGDDEGVMDEMTPDVKLSVASARRRSKGDIMRMMVRESYGLAHANAPERSQKSKRGSLKKRRSKVGVTIE
jgi:hypothetical protein|tara:strand:+ start:187 stop:564 length:378 start_codon:yes stop_codon:yes gene_type:complete